MRFLADENVPGALVTGLLDAGHDMSWIRLLNPGCSDEEVLTRAADERRVLVTFDKDFGELAAGRSAPSSFGIVLVRVALASPKAAMKIAGILNGRDDWAGAFSVIEPGRIRMKLLPLIQAG